MKPMVRLSILRCPAERFAELRQMAVEADLVLRPGIEAVPALLAVYSGNYATLWQSKGSAASAEGVP